MKRLLIGILILLLVAFGVLAMVKGISIGSLKIESIKDIKSRSQDLDSTLATTNDLTKKVYPDELQKLNSAIKALSLAKEEYQNKTGGIESVEKIEVTEIKTYKVEFLWTKIGNYATKEGATLTMNIKNGKEQGNYDLDFILVGSYISITDFIYDIENDEDLKFQIKDFKMLTAANAQKATTQNTNNTANKNNTANANNSTNATSTKNSTNNNTNTTSSKQKISDDRILQATFTVENVGIELN